MASIVLVHGARHGGWCWKKILPILRNAGHDPYAVTLTGLGERSHLASPAVNLETHIQDVLGVLRYETVNQVVLVGHSYGGLVISGVADSVPDLIRHRVYLDAPILRSGESLIEVVGEPEATDIRNCARVEGDGWRLPTGITPHYGVTDPADIAWLTAHLTAHPLASFTQKLILGGGADKVPATYVSCSAEAGQANLRSVLVRIGRRRAELLGWPIIELNTAHDAMITEPARLADLISRVASS